MNKPKSRIENIVIQEMNAELLIYDLKDNKAFCLNETSAIIYQLCDGKRTIKEINNEVAEKLNQPINDELIWLALDGLKKEGLLENNAIEIDFNGLNRRQIIRKVGLASLVALPFVASVIAPSAAQAASAGNVALLGACNSTPECQVGLTCATCRGGNCNNQQVCCTGTGTFGPTHVLLGCAGGCSPFVGLVCCSGQAQFISNNCAGPFDGTCVCA